MTRGRRGSSRGRRGRGGRIPSSLKHEISVTLTRYVPPVHPRPRESAFKVRRVLQQTFQLSQDSTSKWISKVACSPKDWIQSVYSTTGFDAIFVHRVSVWSDVVTPASGQTVFPTVKVWYNYPLGSRTYPNFEGRAGGYNERARVGFYVPAHMSGPFSANSTSRFLDVECYSGELSSGKVNFPVQGCVIEVDLTFC